MSTVPRFALPVVALALAACAGGSSNVSAQSPAPAQNAAPGAASAAGPILGPFASQPVILLPTQFVVGGDSLGWAVAAGSPGEYLKAIDDEIVFALQQRRTARQWILPAALARKLRNNVTYAPADIYDIGAGPLRDPKLKTDEPLADPMASNLRSMIALTEARYVLVPIEISFAGPKNAGRAMLKLALVDARSARLVWIGVVASDPSPAFSPAIAAGLASRIADLVAAP